MTTEIFGAAMLALIVILVFSGVAALVGFSVEGVRSFGGSYKERFMGSANTELEDMFIFMDPSNLFILNIIAAVCVPMLVQWLFQIWILTLAVAGVFVFLPGMVWTKMRKKRMRKFEEQLPDSFMMLSSSLGAGASINTALENMVKQAQPPLSQEFGLLIKRMRLGVGLDDALLEMEKRVTLPSFIMASSAIRISREVGGNLVETIKGMAETLRRKRSMEGKVESLTAQGKTQGTFMAVLPIVLGIALSFLEPESMRQLYTTRNGLMVLAVMVFMQVMGFVFIRKITTIDS
jgi:tight adherence protein B